MNEQNLIFQTAYTLNMWHKMNITNAKHLLHCFNHAISIAEIPKLYAFYLLMLSNQN